MVENFRTRVREAINVLPPVPVVMADLLRALSDDEIDLRLLGKIISKDPSMTINVLKIANSALYALPNKVRNVEHAVRMLGVREIASLCIACGVYRMLKPPPGTPTMDLNVFWKHSVATGVIAKMLAKGFSFTESSDLYLGGLVHDAGKIIMDRLVHNVYREVLQLACDTNMPIIEAERCVIGETHGSIGGWLMDKWNLPSIFVDVATYHHSVMETPEEQVLIVAVISLADQVAWLKDFGFGGNISHILLSDRAAFSVLEQMNPGIGGMKIEELIGEPEKVDIEVAEIARMLRET
jgi:HD-like signal output (HDOD) protein